MKEEVERVRHRQEYELRVRARWALTALPYILHGVRQVLHLLSCMDCVLQAREEEEKLLALERRVSERIASSMLSRSG